MSRTSVVLAATFTSLAFALVLGWVTWNVVFGHVDGVFWLIFFGIGNLASQLLVGSRREQPRTPSSRASSRLGSSSCARPPTVGVSWF